MVTNINNLLVKDFIAIEKIKAENLNPLDTELKILTVLTNKPLDYFEELSFNELNKYLTKLRKLLKTNLKAKKRRVIKVGYNIYLSCKDENDFRTNQYTSLKQYEADTLGNLHNILSLIYTKARFKYTFNPDNVFKIAKDIYNNARIGQVYGTLFFFSSRLDKLNKNLIASLEQAKKVIQDRMEVVVKEFQDLGLDTDGTLLSTQLQAETHLKKMS